MVKIMLDSSSDGKQTHPCDYYIPLTVDIGGRAYKDGVDLKAQKFYRLLTQTEDFPKTSQPSPDDFREAFQQVKENGDQLIYLTVSSALSGTYQSANIAKAMAEYEEIYIVDTGAVSHMIGLLARYADNLRKQDLSAEQIVQKLLEVRQKQILFAGLQTLEYLQKGGRLSKTSATVGTIANIKPIISISPDGRVENFAKAIGVKRAIATIVKQVQACTPDPDFEIWSLCTVDEENCQALETALSDVGIPVAGRMQVGPTIGAHVGPSVYGITFVKK